MDHLKARREMTRTMHSIQRMIEKKLSKFPDVTFVMGCNYISERNASLVCEWKFIGNDVLRAKLTEWTPALDTALAFGDTFDESREIDWVHTPSSAEKRAEKTRKGLRILWLEHVKHTPYEGKKQMFDLVKKGVCTKFDWWDKVTDTAPFESVSIDNPRISEKVYAYVARTLAK
jgi:hypothetical protein